MNNLDIDKNLHARNTDGTELHVILLSFFGSATYPTSQVQRFTKHDAPGFLELHYTKAGNIRRATTNLGHNEIQELSDLIVRNLIDNQRPRIAQQVCFSNDRIRGAFRYKDLFQILPADPEFPDATIVIADHPFVLQFRFISSPNPLINN